MRKLLGIFFAGLLGLGLAAQDAEAARRLGGGGSIGKQREMQPVEPRWAPDAPAAAPAPTPQPAAGGSRWLGPVAGLAAGGLLGALLFGGAFEGIKLLDVLVILALAAGLFFLLRAMRRPQPQMARYAGAGGSGPVPELPSGGASAPAASAARVPPGFDAAGFLRQAKLSFTRLQAANDRKDLADLRDFATPDMVEAIARHFAERGDAPQRTRVEALEADLLEVSTEGDTAWASVRFSGTLRDEVSGEAESFDEAWHVTKDLRDANSVWLIAGIQQVQ